MAAIFSIFAVISLTSCKGNENNTEKAEVTSTEAVVSSENEETIDDCFAEHGACLGCRGAR